MHTVSDRLVATKYRPSGFDYLRIMLSVSVIALHSVAIAGGDQDTYWLWTGQLRPIIFFIVPAFFALSGFLVAGSLERNDLPSFLTLRALRIFPALIVEVTLSALIIGPILTTWSLHDYFTNRKFFSYFGNLIGWMHYYLPGVFLDNPFPGVVNLQLWTVPYELECYIAISIVSLIGLYARPKTMLYVVVLVSLLVAGYQCVTGDLPPLRFKPPGRMIVLCFLAGVALYGLRKRVPYNSAMFAVALVLAWLFMDFRETTYLAPLPVAYATMFLGLQNPRRLALLRGADYSYGVYLYGFPVQQTVTYLLPGYRFWWFNLIVSLAIAGVFALMSWHLVESRVLSHRKSALEFVARVVGRLRQRRDAGIDDTDEVASASPPAS